MVAHISRYVALLVAVLGSGAGGVLAEASLPARSSGSHNATAPRPAGNIALRRVRSWRAWERLRPGTLRAQNGSSPVPLEALPVRTGLLSGGAPIVEPLMNLVNVQYLGTVQVGTPGQDVTVIFDTGSSDLWIEGSAFQEGLSSTLSCPGANDCGETVSISYSVGSVVGSLRADRLSIGAWSIAEQTFVLVTAMNGFGNVFFQGVLGLAFPRLSHGGTTVLSHLTGQADVAAFTFLLADEEGTSEFLLGLPPPATYHGGTLTYVPVAVQEWWTFQGSLAVGSTILCEDSLFALDTGTSYLTVPASYFRPFLQTLLPLEHQEQCGRQELTRQYVCPCESRHSAKIVYMLVGGKEFPIYPEDMFTRIGQSSICVLEVQPSADSMPFILGDTFLRTVAAIFDAGNLRIGMAQRVGHTARLSSTREHQLQDRSSPRVGPLLPPHRILSDSWWPPFGALVLAVLAGLCAGYSAGSLCNSRCCQGGTQQGYVRL